MCVIYTRNWIIHTYLIIVILCHTCISCPQNDDYMHVPFHCAWNAHCEKKMVAPSQSWAGKWRPNGKYKYGGGVVADDGTIYCFPSDVESWACWAEFFFERIVGDLKKRDKARPPKKKEGKQVPKSRQLNYFSIFLAGARMELIWDWIRTFDNGPLSRGWLCFEDSARDRRFLSLTHHSCADDSVGWPT